ncbi:MAG: hypothetical protein FJY85_12025 [Deltaproteobacteria bacterium]|nr:hypothetical protein [Deltaproteobacteria bacterium]
MGLAVIGLFLMYRSRIQIPHDDLIRVINTYQATNPIPNMVDGQRFKRHAPKAQIKHELFDYAPERILIVPSDDMVDMLVLNRFHMDNKTAVVSASKYPLHVFEACQRMLEKHPDIPVEIIHDVSSDGLHLKSRLLADKSWNLEGRNVKDLGLFPQDVNRIKTPIWIPSGRPSSVLAARAAPPAVPGEPERKLGVAGEAEKKIGEGMRMPLDFVGPGVMMSALAVAVIGGTLLMSEELLAEEFRKTTKEGTADGGFG